MKKMRSHVLDLGAPSFPLKQKAMGQRTAPIIANITYPEWCQGLRIKTAEGMQPFKLFDWQQETTEKLLGSETQPPLKGRQVIILSSRQTGKTSMMLTMTDYMARSKEQLTAIMIHRTTDDAHDLCRRLKRFTGTDDFKTENLSLLEYEGAGSVLYFRSGNPSRGDEGAMRAGVGISSADWIVIEESQNFANIESVIGYVSPAATHGNPKLVILVGTADSKLSYFYQQLSKAAGGAENLERILSGIREGTEEPFQILDDGVNPIGIISNWRCIPEFAAEPDFLGRIQKELGLSDADIAKHYEMRFDASGVASVFDFALVMAAQDLTLDRYIHAPGDVLFCGIDPAGQGRDWAVCLVLSIEDDEAGQEIYTVRHLYRKRTGTSEQHLSAIANLIAELEPIGATVEKNSMGQVWLENLAGLGYPCNIEGFNTTQPSKQVLIGRLQIALERGILRIPKGVIVDELLAYRRMDNGKLQAGGNAHDDTVMALALALHAAGFNR